MRKVLFLPLLVALAFVAPGNAGTSANLKGVVIARMPAHGELVLASASGRATTLRAPSLPAPGTVVRAAAFRLSDGTSAAKTLHVIGHVRHTAFRGVLVRTVGATSFFAAGRSVVAVHRAPVRTVASARALSSSTDLSPGDAGEIDVTISSDGTLDEDSITPMPSDNADGVTLQVTVTAVTPATATAPGSITLSINGQSLVIPLPAGTVLPPTVVPNATVGFTLQFQQPEGGDDQGENGDDQGEDDNGTTTTTGGTTTTTTTTTSSWSGHHDGHGGQNGGGGDN